MDVNTRNRAELKSYFVKNSIPTESNFAELVDGMLNQKDDGLVKLPGNPLTIEAAGDSNSEKKVLNIYPSFGDQNPAWTLSLNPRANPNDPATARPGFNISDGEGRSRLFIDRSTGDVGIGTSSIHNPQGWNKAVDILGTVHARLNVRSSGGVITSVFSHDNWGGARGVIGTESNHPLTFATNYAHRMFIDTAGNVGIGISEPAQRLHVAGGNGIVNNVFLGNVGHGADWAGFSHSNAVSRTDYGFLHHTSGQYALINKKSGGGFIGFRIDNADKVTIDDSGVMRAIEGLRIDGDRSTHLDNDGAFYRYGGQAYITVDDNLFIRDLGGDIKFHFNTNNGVLDVKGSIYAGNSDIYFTKTDHDHTGIGNTAGYAAIENAKNYDALMILGRAGTALGRRVRLWDHLEVVGTFVNHSDQRAKQDIEDLTYGLEALKNLRPVSFNWKAIPNQHKSLGLIGQEVKSVISEVVYSDEQGSSNPELSISYTSLIPVLINAVKELDAKIERITSESKIR